MIKNKIFIGAIIVGIALSLVLIRVPTNEEFTTLKYFDAKGNEIVPSFSFFDFHASYMKIYLTVHNDKNFPIMCKLISISPIVGFSNKIQEIKPGKTSIFETDLISSNKIGSVFNSRIKCFIEKNNQKIYLPDKVEKIQT